MVACGICSRHRRWIPGLLLSCARRTAPPRKSEASCLQHHLRTPSSCPLAFCCMWICRAAGKPLTQGAPLLKKPQPTFAASAIDPPVDPRTRKLIRPMAQPGYYPGYSTLGQQAFWDAKTRALVLHRVQHIPNIRFFTPSEASLMEVVCDHIIPQSD